MSFETKTFNWYGFLLLLVFLASTTTRGIHGLHSHEEAGHKPVCHSDDHGPVQHVHDDHFSPDHCQLCTFLYSNTFFVEDHTVWTTGSAPVLTQNISPFLAFVASRTSLEHSGRAPPVV